MNRWKPYLVSLASVILVGYLKLWLNEVLQIDSPILLFFGAITISAWYGGFRQGLLAIGLSLIFIYFYFIVPAGTTISPYLWTVRLGLYALDCVIISLLCAMLRHSEDTLRSSEGRLRKVFESNMIGLVFSRLDGTILEANDYFLRLVDVKPEDIEAGKVNWRDITPPEYAKQSSDAVSELGRGRAVTPYEKEYTRPDGSRVQVVVGATIFDNTVVAFVLDNRDRKKTEQAMAQINSRLEEGVSMRTKQLTDANNELSRLIQEGAAAADRERGSRSFLDSVIENIPNMIFVKDAKDLRFVRFNRAGEELVGASRDDLVGKNDYDFFPKDQADFFTEKDRAVLRSGVVIDIPEEEIATPRGVRYLHTKKIPLVDKDGNAEYLLGISEDITDKKDSERRKNELYQAQAARTEAEKSAARLAFLASASAALNESLDIQSMLNSFTTVLVKQLTGACIIDFYEESAGTIERVVSACLGTNGDVQVDNESYVEKINVKTQDGLGAVLGGGHSKVHHDVPPDVLRSYVRDEKTYRKIVACGGRSLMSVPLIYHGKVFGTLTFVVQELSFADGDLDLPIAQDLARRASFAIENAQLFHQANEASRAKSAFLANISHEIRTPLGAMLGFAELALESGKLEPEQNGQISTIVRNGRQLLRIVDEILDLSKVESERLQIERVSFSLPKVLEEVVALLAVRADEKGLRFSIRSAPNLPARVKTDPLRLRQILLNIVGNAIKFTAQGEVEVIASFIPSAHSPQSGQLQFLIRDTGIGIDEAQVGKLFEPFVQADDSMTRKFGGTGLGLFLSRKLARLMGGDVKLEQSVPDHGSVFKITVSVETAATEPKPSADGAGKEIPPVPAPGRILVVDDSVDNQIMMQAFLGKMGIKSDTADNGKQAVEKAMAGEYDVVLMDLQMPEMDGFEAVRRLREQGYQRPVVAFTAHAMKGDRERCLERGFDDYLRKPIERTTLSHCLAQFMGSPHPSA